MSTVGFIRPKCDHDRKDMPTAQGWVFCCPDCFDASIRMNILKYADCMTAERLDRELKDARAQIQQQASDLEDMKLSRRTAFIRCSCGRLKDLNLPCRACSI